MCLIIHVSTGYNPYHSRSPCQLHTHTHKPDKPTVLPWILRKSWKQTDRKSSEWTFQLRAHVAQDWHQAHVLVQWNIFYRRRWLPTLEMVLVILRNVLPAWCFYIKSSPHSWMELSSRLTHSQKNTTVFYHIKLFLNHSTAFTCQLHVVVIFKKKSPH